MDLRKLKTLIDLVSESNVSELEITEAEGKVRIVKGGVALVQQFGAEGGVGLLQGGAAGKLSILKAAQAGHVTGQVAADRGVDVGLQPEALRHRRTGHAEDHRRAGTQPAPHGRPRARAGPGRPVEFR